MEYYEAMTFKKGDEVNFEAAEFVECTFVDLELSEKGMRNSKFIECEFQKCNCSNIDVLNSSFREVKFDNCKLVGVNWSSVQGIASLVLQNSNLSYGVFQDLNLSHTRFIDCLIREVDFSQSNLEGSIFTNSNLRGSFFTGCNLSHADLSEATEYTIDPQYTKLKKAKFSMPEAMSLLDSLEIILE